LNIFKTTAKINSIFLAVILIAGTFAAVYPSFILGVQAQSGPYNYGMDNSYEPEREYENSYSYGPEYQPGYKDRDYNEYEQDYEMDRYETSYQHDYNEQPKEYPSYKEDYKQEYPQYGKDNNSYKSKDKERSSVSINKVNCINNNVNINGNNTGDINVGNSGRLASSQGTDGEGYLGVGSSGGNGQEYDNGYKKQKGESFNCIINNNNTNNNFGAGNATDGNGDIIDTCEECFLDVLGPTDLTVFENYLNGLVEPTEYHNLAEYCTFTQVLIDSGTSPIVLEENINGILVNAGIVLEPIEITNLVACLFEALG
jgi:hypothetical protein